MRNKIFLTANKFVFILSVFLFSFLIPGFSQKITVDRNKPENIKEFNKLGFGMFIHWSIDVQLGAIISHNVAVGSQDYQDQYFNMLPKTFNPKKFDPEEWAVLAKLAGMKYMVFTAKHHNGFCMWDTKTGNFKITNTPYGKDILEEIINAFRKYDIKTGLYFSPDDYYQSYLQGLPPSRNTPETECSNNEKIWETNKIQLEELLNNYGKIDYLFIDEKTDWANPLVADYCWDLDPDLTITRGGMATPEQHLPDEPVPSPWEACFTMADHWQYVAGETLKDGTKMIDMLIETRAKGGNLLLNVGPTAYGEIAPEQEAKLREIALWNMANHEAVYNVKPFDVIKNGDIWFTQSLDEKLVFAFLPGENWEWMERKEFLLPMFLATDCTDISVLGQNDKVMEYNISVSPKTYFVNTHEGMIVSVIKGQRLNKTWDNRIVLKMSNVLFNNRK